MKISLYTMCFLLLWVNTGFASERPTVSALLLETPFNAQHIQQVLAGKIVNTDVVPVSKKELALGVACLVKNAAQSNLDAIHKGTWLAPEQHIILSSMLPEKAALADFEDLRFNASNEHELQRFNDANAGYELNLSQQEIREFEKLKTTHNSQMDVQATEQLIRRMLLARYQNYLIQGLQGIAPYARNDHEQAQAGQQMLTSLQESLALKKLYPRLYAVLKAYPQGMSDFVVEDYFWYLVNLGDRPAVGLSHRLHSDSDVATLLIERGYYISHTLDSVQVLVGLIQVQEGTLLIYINRTWTEEISGLFSFVKRKIAHNIMLSEMEHVMKNIQLCRDAD